MGHRRGSLSETDLIARISGETQLHYYFSCNTAIVNIYKAWWIFRSVCMRNDGRWGCPASPSLANGDHFSPLGVSKPYLVCWRTRLLSTIIPQLCHRATDVIPSLQLYPMAPVSPPQLHFLLVLKVTIYYLCYGNSKFGLPLPLTGYHFQPRGKGHLYSSLHWFNHTWGEELMPRLNMVLRLFYY